MNHRLVGEEVTYILDHSDAVAVLVSDRFLPMVEAVRPAASKVRRFVLLGAERRPWAEHLDDLLASGGTDPVELPAGGGVGASMIYTGGTTRRPKGPRRPRAPPPDLIVTPRA